MAVVAVVAMVGFTALSNAQRGYLVRLPQQTPPTPTVIRTVESAGTVHEAQVTLDCGSDHNPPSGTTLTCTASVVDQAGQAPSNGTLVWTHDRSPPPPDRTCTITASSTPCTGGSTDAFSIVVSGSSGQSFTIQVQYGPPFPLGWDPNAPNIAASWTGTIA